MRGGGGDSFDGDDKNRVRRRANERRESRTQNILGKGVLAAFFLLFFLDSQNEQKHQHLPSHDTRHGHHVPTIHTHRRR